MPLISTVSALCGNVFRAAILFAVLKLILAPWWLRLPIVAAVMAAIAAPLSATMFGAGHRITAAAVALIIGTLAAAAAVFMKHRLHQLYVAALSCLDPSQRRAAVAAVGGGPVPADPAALGGALRLCSLVVSARERVAYWPHLIPGWALLYVVFASSDVLDQNLPHAAGYLIAATAMVLTLWVERRSANRSRRQLVVLSAAVEQRLATTIRAGVSPWSLHSEIGVAAPG